MRRLDEDGPAAVRPARGVHIVVPRALFPGEAGALLPVPGEGRFIFTVPWESVTVIGTTDSDHDGALDDPQPTEREIAQLLAESNASLAEPLERADVVAAYAGLRPLVSHGAADTADLSRKHRVTASDSGVVTITGGKLTTWRRMAEDTVDALGGILGTLPPCRTTKLALEGASRAQDVAAIAREEDLGAPLLQGLPYVEADVAYAARYEMASTVEDVLARRTRATTETRDAESSRAARRRAPRRECLTASARRTRSPRFPKPRFALFSASGTSPTTERAASARRTGGRSRRCGAPPATRPPLRLGSPFPNPLTMCAPSSRSVRASAFP